MVCLPEHEVQKLNVVKTGVQVEVHVRLKVQEEGDFRSWLTRNRKDVIPGETGAELSDEEPVSVNEGIRTGIVGSAAADGPLSEGGTDSVPCRHATAGLHDRGVDFHRGEALRTWTAGMIWEERTCEPRQKLKPISV